MTPPLHLRLPATSANLGPGFDTLGLALSLYLTIDAHEAPAMSIAATGRDAAICGALSNNLILMTYIEVLGDLGLPAPPIALVLHNEIPLGMGCGSSAAALLAGVLLARHFGGLAWTQQQVLDEATRREGHPDNIAACLLGGLTISATLTDHTVAVSLARDLRWRLLLALPTRSLSTAEARRVLPAAYSRHDTVANLQATALLVAAFASDHPDLLRTAMRDRLHQPFRAPLCPLFSRLQPVAEMPGVLGLALSGAGPAVLLLVAPKFTSTLIETVAGDEMEALLELQIAGPTEDSSRSTR